MTGRPRTRAAVEDVGIRIDIAEIADVVRARFPGAQPGERSRLPLPDGVVVFIDWLAGTLGGAFPLWRCPACLHRRRVLLAGGFGIGCRNCVRVRGRRLIYASQRWDPAMRAQMRTDKLAARVGGVDGCIEGKPPRMWWRTFNRELARVQASEDRRVALMCGWSVAQLNAEVA